MIGVDFKPLYESHVRNALNDTFGTAVATLILATATNESGVNTFGEMSRDDFLNLVDAVCDDQRCVDMWGVAGCGDRRQQWRALA